MPQARFNRLLIPLPYLALLLGFLLLANAEELAGKLVGSGLILAAAMAVLLRLSRHEAGEAGPWDKESQAPLSGSHLPLLTWDHSLSVGNDQLDRQHRRLFSLGNELLLALAERRARVEIFQLLEGLGTEIAEHFHAEESYLIHHAGHNFPNHRHLHQALLARLAEIRQEVALGETEMETVATFIRQEIIARHLRHDDLLVLRA